MNLGLKVQLNPKTTAMDLEAKVPGNISKSMVKKALHAKDCRAQKKPLLQDGHKKARMKFADDHQDKDLAF